ncbi:MAG: hypothetical protein ACQCN6_02845 [Candidatus Bathyarchaeia archaeon]
MVMTIPAIPTTTAQENNTQATYPFIEAIPNPAGVGQRVIVRFGILQALANTFLGWKNITVTVVKPDNHTETLGPFTTDSTGGSTTIYIPDQIGTYKLTTNFPEQPMPSDIFDSERGAFIPEGTIMKASTSETINLVVNENAGPAYPEQPLPAEYWTRPIDAQLINWATVSGNWVARPANNVALYNEYAPQTPHVLWTTPLVYGGLAGGLYGDNLLPAGSPTGDAYEGKFPNSVVIHGVLYYNVAGAPMGGSTETNGIKAVDLHTGKELWFRNNTFLSFGQTFSFHGFNYDGTFAYLWDTSSTPGTWTAYDPFSGEWSYSMTNVPSGTQVYGPNGEILIYVIDYAHGWMALWNSTACGQQAAQGGYAVGADLGSWGRIVHKHTWNASDPHSYSWNVTIPMGLTASSSFGASTLKVQSDRIVGIFYNQTLVRTWGISLDPSSRGQLLFDKSWTPPAEWLSGFNTLHYAGATDQAENGVIAVWDKELTRFYGFSTMDGSYLWTTGGEYWSDAYGWGNVEHTWYFAYDHLYSVGVGGIVYAYNLHTGATDWTYNMTDPYGEPVTGNNWWGWIELIANGMIYVGTTEHSANQPLPRGGPFICLNATDGTEIFRVNGMMRATRWGGNAVMGDSIIAGMDTYDQQVWAIGKGPSMTTVTAGPKSTMMGSSIVIEGTVLDMSPGTSSDNLALRFPSGVPAVSDASMGDWMLYVYKQFARPSNATGVDVTFSVIDGNGNFREIGHTTSDANGYYSFSWVPDISGNYIVYANFAGSNSYWPSYAETSFAVDEPASTPLPTVNAVNYATTSDLMMYIVGATIAIIVAIAVVGLLILRKRP